MIVKNLHNTVSYHRCVELVEEGKFTKSILIPMKWEIEYELGSWHAADMFVIRLSKIFGNPSQIINWANNYNALWFYSQSKHSTMAQFEKWHVVVNLTTDEQLSYMTIAFPDTIIRKARLAS